MGAVEYFEPWRDDFADPTLQQVIGLMRMDYSEQWSPYSPEGWHKRGNLPTEQLIRI